MDNKTCMRFEVHEGSDKYAKKTLFVKSIWEPSSFSLALSDGLRAWTFNGSECFVKERAGAWDKPVEWYMENIRKHLTVPQPGVEYRFTSTRDSAKKLSFDLQIEDADLSLTVNLPVQEASDQENVTCDLLGFLLDGNCQLTENYHRKCKSFDRMKKESEACLEQSTRFKNEKVQFEEDIYKKLWQFLIPRKRS